MEDEGRVELRDDILVFPVADRTIGHVVGEVYVDRALELFKNEFSTSADVVHYVNSFRNPRDAEDFLSLSYFVSIARRSKTDIFSLIMLISVAEKLSEDGVDFKDWIVCEEARKTLENEGLFPITDFAKWEEARTKLHSEYSEKHGSRRAFLAFLEKHLTDVQKIEVVKGIRSKPVELPKKQNEEDEKEGVVFDHLMPDCFSYESCQAGSKHCLAPENYRLESNPCLLSIEFKRSVNLLYDVRNKFVHAAFWGASPPKKDLFPVGINGFIKNNKGRLKQIGVGLSYDTLEAFVLRAMKEHFDRMR